MKTIRDNRQTMRKITEETAERNIYCHPNPIARDIFWQRLELLAKGIQENSSDKNNVLDFGGGSGAFLKGLSSLFKTVEVIDLDPADAQKMRDYHKLNNVIIHKEDIQKWKPKQPFNAVVATDVLEHFQNLDVPINQIKNFLDPNGILCISVPTENWIYLLGRKLINKKKPADHYHNSQTILQKLEKEGFHPIWKNQAPQYAGIQIPLFDLAIFKR